MIDQFLKKQREDEQLRDYLDRRDFLVKTALSGSVLGAGFTSFEQFANAQEEAADDHMFLFIELRGGLQWTMATDGHDISKMPITDDKAVYPIEVKDELFSKERYEELARPADDADRKRRTIMNGDFCILSYIDSIEKSYKTGKTSLGAPYTLGWCAQPGFGATTGLAEHVDDIAVVRGVHMKADFHGPANQEIFTGDNTRDNPHVAGVLSRFLQGNYGTRLLDNLVFENATFAGESSDKINSPIFLFTESLGHIAKNIDLGTGGSAKDRFTAARRVAEALAQRSNLGPTHRFVFESYVGAMKNANDIKKELAKLSNALSDEDASLNLNLQFDVAYTLLRSKLTRVMTLALGSPNGKNQVDGFGLFDCHQGLLHFDGSDRLANTMRHQRNVIHTMDALAAFIKKLKNTQMPNGKTLFDMVTVVVGTEFARPTNLFGNEASGGESGTNMNGDPILRTAFGNGHYWFNNNYIMFGKGIKGGAWLGRNRELTKLGQNVDLASLKTTNLSDEGDDRVKYSDFEVDPNSFTLKDYKKTGPVRPIMARDVMRTVIAAAGYDDKYKEIYSSAAFEDAVVLDPILEDPPS